jgi:hypothetical protein
MNSGNPLGTGRPYKFDIGTEIMFVCIGWIQGTNGGGERGALLLLILHERYLVKIIFTFYRTHE